MLDFLKQIVDFISLIADLVINTVEGILEVFLLLPKYISFVTSSAALLPSVIVGFLLFGFTTSVLLFMVGRD